MSEKYSYVYILTNKKNGTLYTGVTSDLKKRIFQHKQGLIEGFSKKYKTNILVYYEQHHEINHAITREKRIKKWNRQWKIDLIEKRNPFWQDLYSSICGSPIRALPSRDLLLAGMTV